MSDKLNKNVQKDGGETNETALDNWRINLSVGNDNSPSPLMDIVVIASQPATFPEDTVPPLIYNNSFTFPNKPDNDIQRNRLLTFPEIQEFAHTTDNRNSLDIMKNASQTLTSMIN